MLLPILAIVVFVVTLALVTSLMFFFVESPLSRRKMMTRLSALQEASVRGEEVTDVLRRDLLSDIPTFDRILATAPGIRNLKLFLEQAAIPMQVGTFIMICVALVIMGFTATVIVGFPSYLAFAAGLVAGTIRS